MRDRTPLGHAHREHIRDLSIEQVREMYRQAINRLLNEVAETEQFFRAGIIAIDITEADPFTGDRTDHEDEIIFERLREIDVVVFTSTCWNNRW